MHQRDGQFTTTIAMKEKQIESWRLFVCLYVLTCVKCHTHVCMQHDRSELMRVFDSVQSGVTSTLYPLSVRFSTLAIHHYRPFFPLCYSQPLRDASRGRQPLQQQQRQRYVITMWREANYCLILHVLLILADRRWYRSDNNQIFDDANPAPLVR